MKFSRMRLATALFAAALVLAPGVAQAAPKPATTTAPADATAAISASLEQGLKAFNKGDFEGYLHDFFPRLSYNGIVVDRARLVEINEDLKKSFPDLVMRYRRVRVNPLGADQATATTVAEFTGKTANYEGSGLPATYREEGQVTALYRKAGAKWATHQLQVSWNDSYIDIGRDFGMMGFSNLPTLASTEQPYRLRLHVGRDDRPGVAVQYAYLIAPMEQLIEKQDAEKVFGTMRFAPLPESGLDRALEAPAKAGTYAHILVVNKVVGFGDNQMILGQKVYTRLLRVE